MAKVSYESERSFAYRQDLSGSMQYLGEDYGSKGYLKDSVDDTGFEKVMLIQPGQKPAARKNQPTCIPMGLEVLQDLDQFVIKQIYESEAWWNTSNFKVENGRGSEILEVKQEKGSNNCVQAVLGNMRHYYMKVYVDNSNWIMELEHPWSFSSPIFCPWKSPSIIVRMPTGELLGQVRNAPRETCGACLPPTNYFEVFNYEGMMTYKGNGPTCYPCECSRNDPAVFELMKIDKMGNSAVVGRINHEWRGVCGGVSRCCVTEEPERVSVTSRTSFPNATDSVHVGYPMFSDG